jgi:hypothetical protein
MGYVSALAEHVRATGVVLVCGHRVVWRRLLARLRARRAAPAGRGVGVSVGGLALTSWLSCRVGVPRAQCDPGGCEAAVDEQRGVGVGLADAVWCGE